MSFTPFSIDNILADSVPKRCRTSPEVKLNQFATAEYHQQIVPCAQYQTPSLDQHSSAHENYSSDEGFITATSPDATSSPSTPEMSRAICAPTSQFIDTPISSKSGSNPTTSTPYPRSRKSDHGNISPCQLSPVPSTASDDGQEESKKKKARTSFSVHQIDQLERKFAGQRYLGASERSQLADSLNLSDHQVKTWFQNRRMKEKRQIREAEERLGHPVTSLPAHITSVPSHLIMAPTHAFHGRYSAEVSPVSYLPLPTMHMGPYSSLPQHPLPPVGHELYQQPYPSPLAPKTSPIGHSLYHSNVPLRVQVGF